MDRQGSGDKLNQKPLAIKALVPRNNSGHQFVCYGDCCSGIPNGPHEANFAAVNAVVVQLEPQPDFICFLGDELKGLTADDEVLRKQWQHWLEQEMAWLDRESVPLYQTTGNHTTYNIASEAIFRAMNPHLPKNGPSGQEGLSYYIRRDDLLLVFVNTAWSGLGGDGRVETEWLEQILTAHNDARYRLVCGHHPVYPINGFTGPYQRNIDAKNGQNFWQVLVRHQVLAYICSHIMAFDVQIHDGVLQIMTAGAGTLPLMPVGIEYLHCVQMAVDLTGLRYQTLDRSGNVREWLAWPWNIPSSKRWQPLAAGHQAAPIGDDDSEQELQTQFVVWKFEGICARSGSGDGQTLLCGWTPGPGLGPWWIGFRGQEKRLCFLLSAEAGRSPHFWLGPTVSPGEPFSIQVAIHPHMGPGGFLWRWGDASPWSSLKGATPWGAERFGRQTRWTVGHDQYGAHSQPFRGQGLKVTWHSETMTLDYE